jgi:hypothetical protein
MKGKAKDFYGEKEMKTMQTLTFRVQAADCVNNLFGLYFVLFILQFAFCTAASLAYAVPETMEVRITDVTPSSFSVVWMTDVAATPSVEIYTDSSMAQQATGFTISSMPAGSSSVAQAAQAKGIMKVRVAGAAPATTYYVRTVTKDPANSDSISYSGLQQVTTASNVALYANISGTPQACVNDLVAFPVYIRPAYASTETGLGDLVILEEQDGLYPVSAFIGDGVVSPEGILDLNNIFGQDGASLNISGSEKITLRIYRAGALSTLTHYRKAPLNSFLVSIADPAKGFFADINLDGKVDDEDFSLFKVQYRTLPDDAGYNPDYNFVEDSGGKVDIQEFGKFSKEYGRTDVQ